MSEKIRVKEKLKENKNGEMIADEVAEFKAVLVKAGDTVFMPPKYGHLVVNTGETYFVTADDSPVNFGDKDPSSFPGHADYELVKQMRGFAYYVVENDGKLALWCATCGKLKPIKVIDDKVVVVENSGNTN